MPIACFSPESNSVFKVWHGQCDYLIPSNSETKNQNERVIMFRKAMFGMIAMVGLIAISTGTASAYGYNGHNHNGHNNWNNHHGYRPGAAYGRYAPRVVVNPPVYANG